MKSKTVKCFLLCGVALLFLCGGTLAQQTTGSIQGIVTDTTGGVVPGVAVTISNPSTGREIAAVTNDSGLYVVRSLPAGRYEVSAALAGFKTARLEVTVEVGQQASANFELQVGEISEIVTVQSSQIQVNQTENTVSGTVTAREVRELPLNGRSFLDLAQTEPGVQLVDGGSFDPTKNQMTGVSVGGRTGRVTRITVDGIDISDETVGTTTQNLSPDAVQEFQVSQSSLDPSTSMTSSGAVNIITRGGTNELHGSAFIFYRDEEVAALPTTRTGNAETIQNLESAEFDREQGGFQVGGPIQKDRLFFFLNYEKLNQDGTTFVSVPNFPQFNSGTTTPFNDNLGLGRLDWNVNDSTTAFARFSHETNNAATGFGGTNLAPFINQNVSNILATGFDVATARLTHSVRFGHSSFDNEISTNNLGLPEFVGANGVAVGLALNSRRDFASGPNRLAPQATYQTNWQWKYDGSWTSGNHTFRYGAELNWIKVNLFASFFGVGPEVRATFNSAARDAIIARGGDPTDPTEYPVSFAILGNGLGAFTEIANNGRSSGGINNTRFAWYASDSWRMTPDFNLNLAVRYEIDTGQVNDDLSLPDSVASIIGGADTRLDKNNFGPQIGFAWQPFGDAKTVVRGGAGIFYETNIFNNAIFDRTDRLPAGLGFNLALPPLTNIDGQGRVLVGGVPVNNIDTTAWSGQPFRNVIDQIAQTQAAFQAATAAQGFDPNNPPLILSNLTTFQAVFTPDYSTPYGIQTNIGVQRQMGPNWIVSADYVRNRSVHSNIVVDLNRQFATDNLNVGAAQAAVAATLADGGFATVDEAIAGGLTITDFGLGSTFQTNDTAFDAINTILTSGLSTYNALQVRVNGRFDDFLPGFIPSMFMNISYSLSEFEGMVADQDFINSGFFNDNYLDERNFGPTSLDRTHNLNATFFLDLPYDFGLNFTQRWATALPATPFLASVVGGTEEIFFTDLDGDGTTGDILTGASRGDFGRGISDADELNGVIQAFNSGVAGGLTPASQALVQAGIFTAAQLQALGAVIPTVPLVPAGQVENDSLLGTDVRISKAFYVGGERVKIEPMVEVFNLFNVANFGGPANGGRALTGELGGFPGSINGTTPGNRTNLLGLGSGAFSQGIPRSVQFAIRVDW